METRHANGHDIEVGMELDGDGVRAYVDGVDMTNRLLSIIGPPQKDMRGMPMPRGEHYTATVVSHLVEIGELVPNQDPC